MFDLTDKIEEANKAIRHHTDAEPQIAVILGSGLGDMVKEMVQEVSIPFSEIPNFPVATVSGHEGSLVFGTMSGKQVAVMQGRAHYYEGYLLPTITLPVRVFKKLGVKIIIITNAAGGLNETYAKGDIVLITDHINMMCVNPLIGKNDDALGPRFPDMSDAYSPRLQALALEAAGKAGIDLKAGVYVGVSGPNYETPAELRFLKLIGGDAVGMSSVPEVIVARHAGIEVLGFSVITDLALPDRAEALKHEEVLQQARETGPILARLVTKIIEGVE